jgi:hypothetical protein
VVGRVMADVVVSGTGGEKVAFMMATGVCVCVCVCARACVRVCVWYVARLSVRLNTYSCRAGAQPCARSGTYNQCAP